VPKLSGCERFTLNDLLKPLLSCDLTISCLAIPLTHQSFPLRDFLQNHRSSAQFAEFRAVLKELQDEGKTEVVGESYMDV